MPITNGDIPQHLTSGLKAAFFRALDGVTAKPVDSLATVIPSTKSEEAYAWLGQVPGMREWTDERMPKGLSEYDFTLKNKHWEASIDVDRDTLEDDQYGQLLVRINGLAEAVARHKRQLVVSLLPLGFTSAAYDTHYFFDTDHSEGSSGTQSNKGTDALAHDSLWAAITAMRKIKDDQGQPLGVDPNLLVVPPDLEELARELLESPDRSDTANRAKNTLYGRLQLEVEPYLTDTNNWYLFDTSKVVKPLILQDRQPVRFAALEAASESGVMRRHHVYGVDARYNAGYGMWQYAYGSLVT